MNRLPESSAPSDHALVDTRATVWVVDDSALQAEAIRHELAGKFDARVFSGGAPALERLGAGEVPDVLVLDLHMPDVSGIEVCRFVRATLNSAQLPIAILTATGTANDLLEALAVGANDFVQKPVSAPELNARVGGLVHLTKLHSRLSEVERKLRLEAVFRERFMATLAHDLRQPLNTVLMGCEVLAQMNMPERAATILQRQHRAAARMQRMVGDLLDSTRHRPESGMPIARRWTDLSEVARGALDEMRLAHPDRELALSVDGPCSGYWDPDRLAQIFSNIVVNALAHGDADCGLHVRLVGTDDTVELRVSNRGRPIPDEVLVTLNQPFRRSREPRRPSEGFGLGLHIVQHIVHAHGGTLESENQDGVTHVIIRLPRQEG